MSYFSVKLLSVLITQGQFQFIKYQNRTNYQPKATG